MGWEGQEAVQRYKSAKLEKIKTRILRFGMTISGRFYVTITARMFYKLIRMPLRPHRDSSSGQSSLFIPHGLGSIPGAAKFPEV